MPEVRLPTPSSNITENMTNATPYVITQIEEQTRTESLDPLYQGVETYITTIPASDMGIRVGGCRFAKQEGRAKLHADVLLRLVLLQK